MSKICHTSARACPQVSRIIDEIRRGRPPKSSRARPSKLRRLEIKLSERDLELIENIAALTDAVSMAEVIHRALREYGRALGARLWGALGAQRVSAGRPVC
jgi:hypothetical protein